MPQGPLTNEQKQYKQIYLIDNFQADILQLNDNPYMEQKLDHEFLIQIYLEPARKRLYLERAKDKTPKTQVDILKNFEDYILQFDEQTINKIKTDYGNEYQGVYDQQLKKEEIKHQIVDPQTQDKLALSSINNYCKYIRNLIYEKMGKEAEDKIIKEQDIDKYLKEIMQEHNFKKLVKPYDTEPVNITQEQVEIFNKFKGIHNEEVDLRDDLNIGDLVYIQNKKQKLEKARTKKWSKQTYKIINKQKRYYIITPEPFNVEDYKRAFDRNKNDIVLKPCYFRKFYEIKKAQQQVDKYYPLQNEDQQYFTFKKIKKCVNRKGETIQNNDDLKDSDLYLLDLYNENKDYYVSVKEIRKPEGIVNEAELYFWYDFPKNENVQFYMRQ